MQMLATGIRMWDMDTYFDDLLIVINITPPNYSDGLRIYFASHLTKKLIAIAKKYDLYIAEI